MNTGKIWSRIRATAKGRKAEKYVKVISDILITASRRPRFHNQEVVIVETMDGSRAVMMVWELRDMYMPTVHNTFLEATMKNT